MLCKRITTFFLSDLRDEQSLNIQTYIPTGHEVCISRLIQWSIAMQHIGNKQSVALVKFPVLSFEIKVLIKVWSECKLTRWNSKYIFYGISPAKSCQVSPSHATWLKYSFVGDSLRTVFTWKVYKKHEPHHFSKSSSFQNNSNKTTTFLSYFPPSKKCSQKKRAIWNLKKNI